MSFPFPQLLAFLEEEKDQVEFMKVAAEVGIGSGDIELAKLLVALQIYKAYYAKIPRQIKAVHGEAVQEFRHMVAAIDAIADRATEDASAIGHKADDILRALRAIQPEEVAKQAHKRLLDDTLKILGGSAQMLKTAHGQIDIATQKMNDAAYQAQTAIYAWQTLSLRQIWVSAFCFCLPAAFVLLAGVWIVFLRHQAWWQSLQ